MIFAVHIKNQRIIKFKLELLLIAFKLIINTISNENDHFEDIY
jgi:hypothetical protein